MREEFLDFSEDYDPLKAFFAGEQQQIFMRTLDMLAIYDDSKTYIVDSALEDVVAQMRGIVQQEKPYGNIPKLPKLREQFMAAYVKVLKTEQAPVLDTIDQAEKRVLEVLSGKEYEEQKRSSYNEQFREIRDGAERCNNVSTLRSFGDKADALKLRLLNEMDAMDDQITEKKAEEARMRIQEQVKEALSKAPPPIAKPTTFFRRTKRISIKRVTGTASWRLETVEDVDKYLAELREKLTEELDTNTIVNLEF